MAAFLALSRVRVRPVQTFAGAGTGVQATASQGARIPSPIAANSQWLVEGRVAMSPGHSWIAGTDPLPESKAYIGASLLSRLQPRDCCPERGCDIQTVNLKPSPAPYARPTGPGARSLWRADAAGHVLWAMFLIWTGCRLSSSCRWVSAKPDCARVALQP